VFEGGLQIFGEKAEKFSPSSTWAAPHRKLVPTQKNSLFILNLIKAYEDIVFLHVKVKKQLDCKANRNIESSQGTVLEQCSLQVWVW
jgi:hypothetical protein